MSEETSATLTIGMWFLATLALIALFISAGMIGAFTQWHIIFTTVILALVIGATPFILRMRNSDIAQTEREKAKRERIDKMLRDMSDEELLELKQRLSDGNYSDDSIIDYLSDDGELVYRK